MLMFNKAQFNMNLSNFLVQQYGISPARFQENADLSRFFKVLTTSADEDNKVRISRYYSG